MYIDHISLLDSRTYALLSLPLSAGVTVFLGSNGVGKTNIVEAIDYAASLSSHRVSHDGPLVRMGASRAYIRTRTVRGSQQTVTEFEIAPGQSNRVRINRAAPVRAKEALGIARTVLFSPEDLQLVKGDPAGRRRFVDELAKQGYIEGKNIEIDLQNAQGEQRNLKTISQQLAESSDVVLAIATPSAQSLANTTQTTPVIFSAVTDPVSAKLVESREHPGGNVTGTSDQSSDAILTQINLIKKVLPKAKTIGILYTQSEPNSVVQKDEAKRLLEEKGFTVVEKTILDSNNVKAAAESLMAEVDMVFVPTDNIISSTMETVKQVSIKHKVPVFGGSTEMIAVGGLYNYGTNYEELGRQTARMLIRVLKGEKSENIAVELPEKLELHTNQEMADALGIDISKLEGKE